MDDLNLGFFAKLFMDKLANKRQGTETKTRPNKKSSNVQNKNQTLTRRRMPAPAGNITPYSLHPSQLIAIKQFEALRMQLLRQLVIYQKQLLALRMPMMPPLQQQMCPTHQSPFWPQYQDNRASKPFGMNMTPMSQFGVDGDWTSKQSTRSQDNKKPKRKTRKGKSKKAKAKITVEERQNRDESPSQTIDFIQQPDRRCCDNEIGQTINKPSVYPEVDPIDPSRLSVASKLESSLREKLKGFTTERCRDFKETKGIKSKTKRVRNPVHINNINPDCPQVLPNNKQLFSYNNATQRFATVKRNGINI